MEGLQILGERLGSMGVKYSSAGAHKVDDVKTATARSVLYGQGASKVYKTDVSEIVPKTSVYAKYMESILRGVEV